MGVSGGGGGSMLKSKPHLVTPLPSPLLFALVRAAKVATSRV